MAQYKIDLNQAITIITQLRGCYEQIKAARFYLSTMKKSLQYQSSADIYAVVMRMKNVLKKFDDLIDDMKILQEALIYIGDKSEDADRQVRNILRNHNIMNLFDDVKDIVDDFSKHFQGWFDNSDENNNAESSGNNVIYYKPIHTIVLNDKEYEEGVVHEIERVYTEDYYDAEKTEYWESQVGNTVGHIINENGGYTEYYGSGNLSYRGGYEGECTWYAYGRFYEVTGIKLNQANAARRWIRDCQNDSRVKIVDYPVAGSIAVSEKGSYGHVMFIEHVTYDAQGNPEYIYYTEANVDTPDNGIGNVKGKYDAGQDGVLKKLSYSAFISEWSPSGYIAAA